MIVSHSFRFCFIKTRKTAGTSIEVALAPLLGRNDWLSPLKEHDKRTNRLARSFARQLRTRIEDVRPRNPHLPVSTIDTYFSDDTQGYFRFCVERNPWDKAVSAFFWLTKRRGTFPGKTVEEQFFNFVSGPRLGHFSDFGLYSANGQIAVDIVLEYSQLREQLFELAAADRIPFFDIGNTRMKSEQRPGRTSDLTKLYGKDFSNEASDIIRRVFHREIEHFGYEPTNLLP